MSFLVLLLVALILRFTPWRHGFPLDVLGRWTAWVWRVAGRRPIWQRIMLLALPLPLLGLVLWGVHETAYGLVSLALQTCLLFLCVGRTDPMGKLTAPLDEAWLRQDYEAASLLAEQEFGVLGEDSQDLIAAVRGHLVWEACHGYFAPAFWFVLLGPIAAIGYRLAWLAEQQNPDGRESFAAETTHALEWLPIRLMGLGFALVGHFDRTLRAVRDTLTQWDISSKKLARLYVNVALDADAEAGVSPLASARVLLQRTVLVWAVAIAFLVLVG
ncbi:MAG TPA: regulatory signaling modulator protein AmpE [Pseudomonas xinjiangensis]|uniref:Regulatory signaling modulator protein AmpE n=2 Tax=root TaxID=1 RepID=A0A7V1BNS9_9GAMM|nr:regulatory signaling modulator protein AmpE [Halopseudomonas xinjiangensis]HEC46569.1 regulatory signaling modulator protein AmpE [Halopseudomonas xinjiangensis]